MPLKEGMGCNMETGRLRFTRFLKVEPISRPAFVPLTQGVLVRVGGIPLEELTLDPTLWAHSLQKTVELFGLDGVVAGFNFSLMAEACGCESSWENDRPVTLVPPSELCQIPEERGRMKHALETAKRVFQVCRQERACVAALTGPVTLATQLFGQEQGPERIGEIKQLVVRVTEAFCQIRPDVLLFMEERPLALTEINLTHRRIYSTLKNISSYYNIPIGLYLQGYRSPHLARFSKLKMDFYILGPSLDSVMPALSDLWNLGHDALGVGMSLPLDNLEKVRELITQGLDFYKTKGGPGFFFTSHGPVTRDVNLDILHQVTKELRQVRL